MKLGCMSMTRKRKFSPVNGFTKTTHVQESKNELIGSGSEGNVNSFSFFFDFGVNVNVLFYRSVLQHLHESVQRKRSDLWRTQAWILYHDNARPHTYSLIINEFLARNNLPTVLQPPYSPHLSSCEFFLFPRIKLVLKGWLSHLERK